VVALATPRAPRSTSKRSVGEAERTRIDESAMVASVSSGQ
jgi:hypothetical protein